MNSDRKIVVHSPFLIIDHCSLLSDLVADVKNVKASMQIWLASGSILYILPAPGTFRSVPRGLNPDPVVGPSRFSSNTLILIMLAWTEAELMFRQSAGAKLIYVI